MVKVKCDGLWPLREARVPPRLRCFEQGCRGKPGASANKRAYAKREAWSASAFSTVEIQEESKVKSRRHARERNCCKSAMVGGDRIDRFRREAQTAWLSM